MPQIDQQFDISHAQVLIVDDIPENRDILARTLEIYGYSLSFAQNGEEALIKARELHPDLILMDILMPGLSGLATCEKLKNNELTRDIPVIFVTSKQDTDDIVECFHVGASDFIPKPIRIKEVRVRVENHLRMRFLVKQRDQLIHQIEAKKREVEDREKRISAILDNIADGILVLDAKGFVERINPVAERIFTSKPDQMVGMNVCDRFPGQPVEGCVESLGSLEKQGYLSIRENSFVECQGMDLLERKFPAEISVCEIPSDGNSPLTYVMVLRDITDRKHVELELRNHRNHLSELVEESTRDYLEARDKALEANRLKSEFLATMSHELRTPLNAIIGFSAALLKGLDGPVNEDQQTSIQMINDGGKKLLKVINEVLDLSKLESGKMDLILEEIVIGEVIQEIVNETQILFRNKGLSVSLEVSEGLPILYLDRQSVRQVMINLVSNACKFTEKGGVVIRVFIEKQTDAEQLVVEVEDSGCGIAGEDFDLVFESFRQVEGGFKRKYGGTGLGLCIAKKFVEMQGGRIFLRSELNQGSVFGISFPVEQSNSVAIDFSI